MGENSSKLVTLLGAAAYSGLNTHAFFPAKMLKSVRLGEFSPVGQLFTLGSLLNNRGSPNFCGYFFHGNM
jgi:hypothetical protein